MVKKKGLESLSGRTGEFTRGSGREVSKMAGESLFRRKGKKGLGFGVTARISAGSTDAWLFLSFNNHANSIVA